MYSNHLLLFSDSKPNSWCNSSLDVPCYSSCYVKGHVVLECLNLIVKRVVSWLMICGITLLKTALQINDRFLMKQGKEECYSVCK